MSKIPGITLLFFIAASLLTPSSAVGQQALPPRLTSAKTQVRYTCPMHPEVVTDRPGKCPKCGMTLVPIKSTAPVKHATHVQQTAANEGDMPGMNHQAATSPQEVPAMHMSMQSSIDLVDPMSRESSGTAWVPDSTPMYGKMFMFGDDMLMLHGAIWPRYVNASTRRGDDRIDAPNWIMAMYSHPFNENAQLGLRAMMSLDLLTEGGRGYPLLFQTGETWHGEALHDRQHPHDLFAELSASYSQKFARDFSSFVYFGMPGEPALGPPTFMHRLSAMDNPDAPIGHHWEDSTHITFGVATLGAVWKNVKIESSIFTGREPDEVRYDFDRPRFDSYSGRISWNPTQNLALQISHGYLHSPEATDPELNQHRTSASAIFNHSLGNDANWATSFVWAQDRNTGERATHSFLVETNFQRGRDTIYARWERVEKSGHELVLDASDRDTVFPVSGYTIGYVRDLTHGKGLDIGMGGQFTLNAMPDRLERYYGTDLPYSFQVFWRVRPSRMVMNHQGEGEMAK